MPTVQGFKKLSASKRVKINIVLNSIFKRKKYGCINKIITNEKHAKQLCINWNLTILIGWEFKYLFVLMGNGDSN